MSSHGPFKNNVTYKVFTNYIYIFKSGILNLNIPGKDLNVNKIHRVNKLKKKIF